MDVISNPFQDFMNLAVGGLKVSDICAAVILFVVGYLVIRVVVGIIAKMLRKTVLAENIQKLLRTSIRVVCYFILIMMILGTLNIPVTSLVAAFSVVGLAFSLAIQNGLTNVTGGVTVLVTKPFSEGNYILFGGLEGTVTKIGLAYTTLTTPDNKTIWIPNSEISAGKVVNVTAQGTRRVDLTFNASYDAPLDAVKAALLKAAAARPEAMQDPAPFAGVMAYQDSSIQYVLRAWTTCDKYWDLYFGLMEDVKKIFDEEGIAMTYSHINVHMMDK